MRTTLVVLIAFLTSAAIAQTEPTPTAPIQTGKAPNSDLQDISDFRRLFDEREELSEQRRTLENTIEDLENKTRNLPPVAEIELDLTRARRELEKAQKAKVPDPGYIDQWERYIESTMDSLEIAKSAQPDLAKQRAERDRIGRRLFMLEQRIASLFDASRDVNRFRTNVTFTFGVLVFVVIVGFYFIAWYKQGVATTIFSGAMGMQFVTLFLIVIAIILFGIMGTLEGKELAALLGGLSGYILGRADSRQTAAANDKEPDKPEPDKP